MYFSSFIFPIRITMASCILLFLMIVICSSAQPTYRNMTAGTTLTPLVGSTSWSSPNREFSFGFLAHPANSSLSLLCVYFTSILPNQSIVWFANGPTPVPAAGSTLTLSSPNGHLSLTDPTGHEIWSPNVANIAQVSMLDTGNLVLSGNDSRILWQSFDHPTDTILPGQTLATNTNAFSRLMDTDFSIGRFKLRLQNDGNLALYQVAYQTPDLQYDPYWNAETVVGPVDELVYNESGSIYLAFPNGTVITTVFSATVSGDYYHRATMDPDGIFRQYTFPKNEPTTGTWMVKQTLASDICNIVTKSGSGACGFNSYCTMDEGNRVACQCPPKYSFIDDTRKYLGCKPDFMPQSCQPSEESASFDFVPVANLNWPEADAELLLMNETECRTECLRDCFCSVAIYSNGSCWKKKYPLSNGKITTDINRKALIKYSTVTTTQHNSVNNYNLKRLLMIWIITVMIFLVSSIVLNLVQFSVRCKRHMLNRSVTGHVLPAFTYRELVQATKGFTEELGRGGFGTVYKGVIGSEPRIFIAVKKLNNLFEIEEENKDFDNEIRSVGLTHHKNLVRLIGFCKEGTNRLLVYEYMSNGSLNKFLFGDKIPDWDLRVQIALGIASGLAYLHEECRTQIIHCDIKPENILLDNTFAARIADFGMAKLLRLEQTRTTKTGIRGTMGYFAPEWFRNSGITAKVDVYSFGVMLLEIVSCKRNWVLEYGTQSEVKPTLTERAKDCWMQKRVDLLVEEMDEDAKIDRERLERFVMVGVLCVQEEPWLRPTMKKVVQMLEGDVEVDTPPGSIGSISSQSSLREE